MSTRPTVLADLTVPSRTDIGLPALTRECVDALGLVRMEPQACGGSDA